MRVKKHENKNHCALRNASKPEDMVQIVAAAKKEKALFVEELRRRKRRIMIRIRRKGEVAV